MSWSNSDYPANRHEEAHIAFLEQQDRIELADLAADEAEERTAREMAFSDTHFCDDACLETLEHTAACQADNAFDADYSDNPVIHAANLRARQQAIRFAAAEHNPHDTWEERAA